MVLDTWHIPPPIPLFGLPFIITGASFKYLSIWEFCIFELNEKTSPVSNNILFVAFAANLILLTLL